MDPPRNPHQLHNNYQPRGSEKEEEEEDQDQSEEEEEDEDDDDEMQHLHSQQECHGHHQHFQQPQLYRRFHGETLDIHHAKSRKESSHLISTSTTLASKQYSIKYARLMQDGFHQSSSRLRLKSTEGERVEVQGGHIVRSIKRKDRHSKVCTSKGPKDRRVRLSAHTAIQFYDVQDRLGYDRPSKAIDWLIEKAKAAIDALAELPMKNHTPTDITTSAQQTEQELTEQNQYEVQPHGWVESGSETITGSNSGYDLQNQQHLDHIPIKSLSSFSIGAATQSSPIHLQNYPPDMNSSRTQALTSASTPLVSDETPTSWFDRQRYEMNWVQRMMACNWDTGSGGEEFAFNSFPRALQQPVLGEDHLFYKREPLQSSNLSSVRAWMNLPISTGDHCQMLGLNPSFTSGVGFTSDEFSGFQIPARIYGEEEEQNAVSI